MHLGMSEAKLSLHTAEAIYDMEAGVKEQDK